MGKVPQRTRTIERLHCTQSVKQGCFKVVGDCAVVWVNSIKLIEEFQDGEWIVIKEKPLGFRPEVVPVGNTIMGIPVVQIDPEWINREKQILANWKKG